MHSNHVYHLDFKPLNVLYYNVSGVYDFYLTDFGISMNADRPSLRGTPYYMAPEIRTTSGTMWESNAYVDMYAFGISLQDLGMPVQRYSQLIAHTPSDRRWLLDL